MSIRVTKYELTITQDGDQAPTFNLAKSEGWDGLKSPFQVLYKGEDFGAVTTGLIAAMIREAEKR